MPILQIDLSNPSDVQAGLDILRQQQATTQQVSCGASAPTRLAQTMVQMKQKKIWQFLHGVANLNVPEYSLPELAAHLGMSSNKVCSLKAILAKPEQRLGVQFFELAPSTAVDAAGNPRYRMPAPIKQAIQTA